MSVTKEEEQEMDSNQLSNEKNKSYQECYQSKGFVINRDWMSIREKKFDMRRDGHDFFETHGLYWSSSFVDLEYRYLSFVWGLSSSTNLEDWAVMCVE